MHQLTTFPKYILDIYNQKERRIQRKPFYGHLKWILECQLDGDEIWGALCHHKLLLAVINPCDTKGNDARLGVVKYQKNLSTIVLDLQNVESIIGRVVVEKSWGIIDRSGGVAKVEFLSKIEGSTVKSKEKADDDSDI